MAERKGFAAKLYSCLSLALLLGTQSCGAKLARRQSFDESDPFNERLQALSLIGSHFGLVDIPATYVSCE